MRPLVLHAALVWVVGASGIGIAIASQEPYHATTTLTISICGDGIVQTNEVCDDGINSGTYATSTAARQCQANCLSFAPYCGDAILQTFFGEECDDGNNTSGDLCNALCQNETPPTTSPGGTGFGGGGGSSGGRNPAGSEDGTIDINRGTEVRVSGLAYPSARITMLIDGSTEGVVEAGSDGRFSRTFTGLTPGATTFGFFAQDRAGRNSITFSSTFEVIQGAVTTLSGITIAPTIAVVPERVSFGQPITVQGFAAPNLPVTTTINNGVLVATTTSAATGEWLLAISTRTLTNESFHGAKAFYRDPSNLLVASGYSRTVNFYVGERGVGDIASPDINQDGRVDLVDFSIFLFNWNTSAAVADFNRDGTVDLADFSIMLFSWTG